MPRGSAQGQEKVIQAKWECPRQHGGYLSQSGGNKAEVGVPETNRKLQWPMMSAQEAKGKYPRPKGSNQGQREASEAKRKHPRPRGSAGGQGEASKAKRKHPRPRGCARGQGKVPEAKGECPRPRRSA